MIRDAAPVLAANCQSLGSRAPAECCVSWHAGCLVIQKRQSLPFIIAGSRPQKNGLGLIARALFVSETSGHWRAKYSSHMGGLKDIDISLMRWTYGPALIPAHSSNVRGHSKALTG